MKIPFSRGSRIISDLEVAASTANNALIKAQAEYDAAVASIADPSPDLDDAQLAGLVERKNAAELALVKAKAADTRTARALTEERTAAAEKEIADEIARVTGLGNSAVKVAREELTAAKKGLRRAIRMMAEAEVAREELNGKLPPDQRIPSFETAVLERPGIPEQITKRERQLRWVNSTGHLFSPEEEARLVEDRRAGTARLPRRPGSLDSGDIVITRRRYFEFIVRLPEIRPWMQGNLSETVQLPGLDGGPAGWIPTSSGSVLRTLAELEAAASAKPREREPVETLQPASPVFKSNEDLAAWEAKQMKADAEPSEAAA